MAGNIPPSLVEPVVTVQHFAPPSARELRAQAVHRLQVGLFGLCAMLLIVGLANIIMDRARLVDAEDPIRAVVAVDAKPKRQVADPLADIGVVPASDPSPTPSATGTGADNAGNAPLDAQ
ncbi:hypothetical protein EDF56_105414 [Novosphingobium sp. PhB165]|uniref:hypothetical protein n=1 Tax=Novosphingobium sp. PhB165 TaxID=2485105 RepID=UPI0010F16136|nr:hypothetical protein [Novosphingobium sp. PhB165]TCM18065.1 hypothetical protein EDF56_105414 [Novosphingobium sp. PhB165]